MLGEDLYFLILETFRRLTISVYEFGAGMGVDECSSFVGGSLGGDGVVVSSSFIERDTGVDGTLNSLLMCTGSNHGIGSRMSIGP